MSMNDTKVGRWGLRLMMGRKFAQLREKVDKFMMVGKRKEEDFK